MTPDDAGRRATWPVVLAYLCGVAGAASVGRIGPVAIAVQEDLRLDLTGVGWLVGSVDGVAAVAGLLAGLLVARLGTWRVMVGGLVVSAVAVVAAAFAEGFGGVVAARLAEGVGYLAVSAAAPSLISTATDGRHRIAAMSLWATYVPVGLAIGSFGGGVVSEAVGWRGWFGVVGGVLALLAVLTFVTWRTAPAPAAGTGSGPVPVRALVGRPLLVALGFCCVVALNLTMISLFPAYLGGPVGMSSAASGTTVGLLTLLAVPGGLLTGWLSGRWLSLRRAAAIAAVVMPAGVLLAFADVGLPGNAVGFGLFVAADGMAVAAVFATVPFAATSADTLSATYGLMAQTAGLASFLLVPGLAALVSATSWWAAVPAAAVVVAVAFGLLWTVLPSQEAVHRRGASPVGSRTWAIE